MNRDINLNEAKYGQHFMTYGGLEVIYFERKNSNKHKLLSPLGIISYTTEGYFIGDSEADKLNTHTILCKKEDLGPDQIRVIANFLHREEVWLKKLLSELTQQQQ